MWTKSSSSSFLLLFMLLFLLFMPPPLLCLHEEGRRKGLEGRPPGVGKKGWRRTPMPPRLPETDEGGR